MGAQGAYYQEAHRVRSTLLRGRDPGWLGRAGTPGCEFHTHGSRPVLRVLPRICVVAGLGREGGESAAGMAAAVVGAGGMSAGGMMLVSGVGAGAGVAVEGISVTVVAVGTAVAVVSVANAQGAKNARGHSLGLRPGSSRVAWAPCDGARRRDPGCSSLRRRADGSGVAGVARRSVVRSETGGLRREAFKTSESSGLRGGQMDVWGVESGGACEGRPCARTRAGQSGLV